MRVVAIALAVLSTCITADFAHAGGQTRLANPQSASEQVFWGNLYAAGGTTLYCGKTFTNSHAQLIASPVYSSKQIKSVLRCSSDQQCTESNSQYPYMLSDLHNLYPELTRVELARRNAQFGSLGANVPSSAEGIDCNLKSSFQLVEPRDEAKGNVARAIFYMHSEYDLPIVGQLQMYKQWNQIDPPDAEEKARNDRIATLQGTRNRYIDDPNLAEALGAK